MFLYCYNFSPGSVNKVIQCFCRLFESTTRIHFYSERLVHGSKRRELFKPSAIGELMLSALILYQRYPNNKKINLPPFRYTENPGLKPDRKSIPVNELTFYPNSLFEHVLLSSGCFSDRLSVPYQHRNSLYS